MLKDVENLLKEKMGLDSASIGSQNVARAVRTQMDERQIADIKDYLSLVRSSGAALQDLIDAVVVPETWFFRDVEAFRTLANTAAGEWAGLRPGQPLNLLSMPCSTGEEPYSMAMALFDAELPSGRFHIDAFDISLHSLEKCKTAVYGKNSFRGNDISFRDRYFESVDGKYRPAERVRDAVTFNQANLFGINFQANAKRYDVVFCRNLLIYFARAEQLRAVEILKRLLNENGLLFVGPAETGLLVESGFESTKIPLSFSFRKFSGNGKPTTTTIATRRRSAPPRPKRTPSQPLRQEVNAFTAMPDVPPAPPPRTALSMDDIESMADAGELEGAMQECQNHLREQGPSARTLYLMGLLYDARGDLTQAARHYQQALYLDANHLRSMQHLALIFSKQGNVSAARAMSERLRRIEQKGARV